MKPAFRPFAIASAATVSLYCHVPSEILHKHGVSTCVRASAHKRTVADGAGERSLVHELRSLGRRTHSGISTPLLRVTQGEAAVQTPAATVLAWVSNNIAEPNIASHPKQLSTATAEG